MAGPVPELLVKKRKRDDAWAAKREAAALEARKKARAQRRSVALAESSSRSDGSGLLPHDGPSSPSCGISGTDSHQTA